MTLYELVGHALECSNAFMCLNDAWFTAYFVPNLVLYSVAGFDSNVDVMK